MRVMKKFGALFCAAALVFSLAACKGGDNGGAGSEAAKEALAAADEKLAAADSMSFSAVIDLAMSASAEGETEEMAISANMDGDIITSPMKMYGKINLDMAELGGTMSLEMYMEEAEDSLDMYIGMMGYWMEQSMDMALLDSDSSTLDFDLYEKANFKSAGEETVGDVTATKYTGTIDGATIEELMNTPELVEMLESMDDTLGMSIDWAEMYSDMGSMSMSIWIDGEGYPVRYEIDAADMANKIVLKAMEMAAAEYGQDLGDVSVTFSKCLIAIDIFNINEVEDFEIPVDTMQLMY